MNSTPGIQSTGCGIVTLWAVALQSPIETLRQYLKNNPPRIQRFDLETKKYVDAHSSGYIHVIFGGPDMTTLTPGKGHYSDKGSCGAFATFLRENSLGSVIETPPRHNPYHNERAEGEGDVIVYVWSPDQVALIEWLKANPTG